jgi:tetratricopeptide (TPR) repeat protein
MRIKPLDIPQERQQTATVTELAQELCAKAKELEEAGKFDDARLTLGEFWERIGDRPRTAGLEEPLQAELLLRVGTLSGWIGGARQIPGAQEFAKDLISESCAIFERLGLTEKVAETRVDLGICYWREGAFDEARVTLDDALQRLGDLESEQRLRAILNQAVVEQECTRPQKALDLLAGVEALYETSSNHALKGKFHNMFAVVLRSVGLAGRREDYIDRALMQYTAASLSFEKAGHDRFLGVVENNLGFLFAHLERFAEAHEHSDRACAVARSLNDQGLLAQFEDTRARIFLGQGHPEQAEKIASAAVKILRKGDQQSLLVGVLTTQATALARVARHSDALAMLTEAMSVAVTAGDPESGGIAALTAIEELGSILSPAETRNYYKSAESALTQSQHTAIRLRVAECARLVLAAEDRESGTFAAVANNGRSTSNSTDGDSHISRLRSHVPPAEAKSISGTLEEQVRLYEGQLIKQALEASDGSVTRAARMLGVTHQGLAFILNGRHKSLLTARKPVKRRRRSIIRFH